MQDASGVRRRARGDSQARNGRDPTLRPTSGKGGPYKPSAKGGRAGRESEGPTVLTRSRVRTAAEGKGPALVARVSGGKCEGMDESPGRMPVPRVDDEPRGLVHDQDRRVLVHDVEGDRLARIGEHPVFGRLPHDEHLPAGHLGARRRGRARDAHPSRLDPRLEPHPRVLGQEPRERLVEPHSRTRAGDDELAHVPRRGNARRCRSSIIVVHLQRTP